MRGLAPSTQRATTLVGATLVAAGSLFPWLTSTGWLSGAGIETGLDTWGLYLLPAVLLLGVVHGLSSRLATDVLTALVGVLSLAAVGLYRVETFLTGYTYGVGWYLTLLGGLVLVVAGTGRVWSRLGRRVGDAGESDDVRSA